ncbi:MAG: DNA starvation/stationary phase protection protein [Bdellovibrionales bacterium]|nr:DNA starvation/stationary phase protection protein [Bdellovibrionales bacterium]
MKPKIGLIDENRNEVVKILNRVLADEYVLFTKTYKYHWNVKGRRFHDLHEFFEEQYTALFQTIDNVAERVRFLGEKPIGTLQQFLSVTTLHEDQDTDVKAHDMVSNLLKDHEKMTQNLRNDLEVCSKEYNDEGTCDFVTGLMQEHEKTAWMLRASIEE